MKSVLNIFLFLMLSNYVLAQDFQMIDDKEFETIFSHKLNDKKLLLTTLNNLDYINFNSNFKITTQKIAEPSLPKFSTSILIPDRGNIELEVIYGSYKEIKDVNVLPSKGNLKRNVDPSTIAYQFGNVYSKNEFYPGNLAEISNPFILRSERGINVSVFPYQYNPVTKVLRVYENIQIVLHYLPNQDGSNEIESNMHTKSFHNSFFLNSKTLKYNAIEENGDLLVICPDSLIETMQPFGNWKNQKGIFTKIIGTSITGNSANSIKNYILSEYNNNPNLLYLLLVGDHTEIPAYIYGTAGGEEIISDTYFGQLAGTDLFPELFVGRFSGNTAQIKNMVDRVLEYEKNPTAGDWMTNAMGIGSSEGAGIGDDNEVDWLHLRNIGNQLTNFGYNQVYEFYDGTHGEQDAAGDPNSGIILPALNNGIGLLNYTGHGDINEMVTGSFTSLNVNNAINNGKYPFVVSVACNNGTFIYGNCLSETWLRASKNGLPTGAIGACGSSILMSWAPPMQTQDEMTAILTESYQNNKKITLGGLFYNAQLSMMENYSGPDGDEVMQTWVFFGDPSVVFRNKITQELVVNHLTQIPKSETQLAVSCNEENATIAISQNNLLLATGIVNDGIVNFTLPTLTSDLPLTVTATKQNFKAYQENIQVTDALPIVQETDFELQSIYPNPSNDFIQINITTITKTTVHLTDITGREVQKIDLELGNSSKKIELAELASGVYQLMIESNNKHQTVKIIKN
jgi:gingipain R